MQQNHFDVVIVGAGLSGQEAAIKTMQEVSGPIVATTLVLLAVFVPVTLMPGISSGPW